MFALSFGSVRACALTFAVCSLALATGCGGAPPEPKSASEPTSQARAQKPARHDAEPEAEPEEAPARSSCDDGGCFACGAGSCPSGWYCDERGRCLQLAARLRKQGELRLSEQNPRQRL